jgi:HAD superfamily hydrolase (TIGR01450 family)
MTLRFLKTNYADALIYCMGTSSYVQELRNNGLRVSEKCEPGIACVVVAYDSELSYEKLCETSKVLLTKDVPFYGTNPDLRCPIDFGFIPDCGAMCNMLTATTDKVPTYLGKPSREVVELCLSLSGFSREETLVVGDRLYTDIACGINGGVDTCVLFTGEAQKKDLKDTPYKPTYEFDTVKDLYLACNV